jgi:hypothetical protein
MSLWELPEPLYISLLSFLSWRRYEVSVDESYAAVVWND